MTRILYMIILCGFFSLSSPAQEPTLRSDLWTDNWKLEIKIGTWSILTPIPEDKLGETNNLNVPLRQLGPMGTFSLKKSLTPHFEAGYQFDYLQVQGEATDVKHLPVEVLTQIFTHTFQVQYNLKRNDDFKPRMNYFVYGKMGGVFPYNKRFTGKQTISETDGRTNLAVVTSTGAGINYQLNKNLSLTVALDINRLANSPIEVLKVYKIPFPDARTTVSNFVELSFGLSWWFNLGKKKKLTNYYRPISETEKIILKAKIEREKGKTSESNNPIWYEPKRGKREDGKVRGGEREKGRFGEGEKGKKWKVRR